jgi:hypothetical protein
MEWYKKTSISQVYTHTHVGKYNKNWDYCLAFIFRVSPSVFFQLSQGTQTLEESERHPHKNKIADSVSSSALKAIFCRTSSNSSGKKYY